MDLGKWKNSNQIPQEKISFFSGRHEAKFGPCLDIKTGASPRNTWYSTGFAGLCNWVSLRANDERTVWRKENFKKFVVWGGIAILLSQNEWEWLSLLLSVIWQQHLAYVRPRSRLSPRNIDFYRSTWGWTHDPGSILKEQCSVGTPPLVLSSPSPLIADCTTTDSMW